MNLPFYLILDSKKLIDISLELFIVVKNNCISIEWLSCDSNALTLMVRTLGSKFSIAVLISVSIASIVNLEKFSNSSDEILQPNSGKKGLSPRLVRTIFFNELIIESSLVNLARSLVPKFLLKLL
jgi:hypothetical protein